MSESEATETRARAVEAMKGIGLDMLSGIDEDFPPEVNAVAMAMAFASLCIEAGFDKAKCVELASMGYDASADQ